MGYGFNVSARMLRHRGQDMQSSVQAGSGNVSFDEQALEQEVRLQLTQEYPHEMEKALENKEERASMRGIIASIARASEHASQLTEGRDFEAACERIYNNIFSFGEIQEMLDSPDVEEINCNSWNHVEVVTRAGVFHRYDVFHSKQECEDTTKRLVRLGGYIADLSKPTGDSDIGPGQRISAMIPPIVPDDRGACFSIRKQRESTITRDDLINGGTASAEILDMVQMLIDFRISTAFAGSTGSGKTTDMNYFLYNTPLKTRIFVIEEGSRELKLDKFDENGNPASRVIYAKTRFSGKENMQNVDQSLLIKIALRFDPDIIAQSEMRGAEGYQVLVASQTGHQVVTTFHATDTRTAYKRYLNMCIQGNQTTPVDMLRTMCYESIPIMCYKELMADGKRRFVEITEAYEYPEGNFRLLPLFRYVISENVYEGDTLKHILGMYEQINYISNRTAYLMHKNGARLEVIRRFARPDYDPMRDADVNGEPEAQKVPDDIREQRRKEMKAAAAAQKEESVETAKPAPRRRTVKKAAGS